MGKKTGGGILREGLKEAERGRERGCAVISGHFVLCSSKGVGEKEHRADHSCLVPGFGSKGIANAKWVKGDLLYTF